MLTPYRRIRLFEGYLERIARLNVTADQTESAELMREVMTSFPELRTTARCALLQVGKLDEDALQADLNDLAFAITRAQAMDEARLREEALRTKVDLGLRHSGGATSPDPLDDMDEAFRQRYFATREAQERERTRVNSAVEAPKKESEKEAITLKKTDSQDE